MMRALYSIFVQHFGLPMEPPLFHILWVVNLWHAWDSDLFHSTLVRLLIPDSLTLKSFPRYLEKADRDSKRYLICNYREIFGVTPGLGTPTFF